MGCHQTQLTTSLCEKLPNVDLCRFGAKSWALRRVGREKSGSATPQWMFRAAALRITGDPCSGEVRSRGFFHIFTEAVCTSIFGKKKSTVEENFLVTTWWNICIYIYIYIYICFFGGGCVVKVCDVFLSMLSHWSLEISAFFASCEVCDPPQRSNHLRGCTSPWLDNVINDVITRWWNFHYFFFNFHPEPCKNDPIWRFCFKMDGIFCILYQMECLDSVFYPV